MMHLFSFMPGLGEQAGIHALLRSSGRGWPVRSSLGHDALCVIYFTGAAMATAIDADFVAAVDDLAALVGADVDADRAA